MIKHGIILFGMVVSLSGCTIFGEKNVKGNFACAPAEGTCAPTLNIDDGAIKKLRENARAGTAVVVPGSTTYIAKPIGRPAKIVFPAYIDAQGRLHEATIVHTRFNDNIVVADQSSMPVATGPWVSGSVDLVTHASKGRPMSPVNPVVSSPVYSPAPVAAGDSVNSAETLPIDQGE
ncbi:MAG: hypothetical protein HC843_04505 [Sphingomonadales bacterium]|nr:hypothetical protein [Sphingomonadales bacterium]